ncbi:MAG: hypothetical protein KAX42_07150, partial [Sphaerotilus sp.]|nr:hypothetical protein [Sphaerotilus sp.]
MPDAPGLPQLKANLVMDWDWRHGQTLVAPTIALQGLRIDVGSLVQNVLLPITQKIEGVLSPIKPFVDMMLTPISGLEFTNLIGIENTPLGLLNGMLKIKGKPQIPTAFFKAVQFAANLPEQVRGWANTGEILLGDLSGFGSGQVKATASSQALPAELVAKFTQIEAQSSGGGSSTSANASRSGFKMLEYIKDIGNWKALLTGGDATLFSYELPVLGFGFDQTVPLGRIPIGPVVLKFDATASFSAFADLAFGYDTQGIRKAISSGNPLDALDGFYVYDFTLPQFRNGKVVAGTGGQEKDEFAVNATVGLQAGVSLGPLSGGLEGAISFYAGLDLQDIARSVLTKDEAGYVTNVAWVSDGKIRGSEIATMYNYQGGGFQNLFNLSMGADFTASVFVELDLWIKTITLLDEELFSVNLFNLNLDAPRVQPVLAEQVGDTLYLNVGDRAGLRRYFDVTDGSENVVLSGAGGTVNIEFDNWYQTYRGVNKVVARLGAGNDKLDASRLAGAQVEIDGGAGNDVLIAGSAGGTLRGGSGNDKLSAVAGMARRLVLDGGAGDDALTGGAGDDDLSGGLGDDKLDSGAGRDRLEGGAGDDQLRGGGDADTYAFGDDWGSDSFNDRDGHVALDFAAMTGGVTLSLGKRAVGAVNALGQEIRLSGATVTDIRLTRWTDRVQVSDFPEWKIDLRDSGGADDYRFTLGRAAATGAEGTVNIIETGSDFDEVILEQTRSTDAVQLDLGSIRNGREHITYQPGAIDRVTLMGKGALYDAEGIASLGGDIRFTAGLQRDGEAVSLLGSTAFRGIGRTVYQGSAMEAGSVVLESVRRLDIRHDLPALHDGHLDLRTHGDAADVVLYADLHSASGATGDDQGAGWIRIQSADGSFINYNGSQIVGANAYLQVKARNAIGSVDKPILTRVAEMTLATARHGIGAGNVVIREDDGLTLVEERVLTSPENPGYVIDTTPGDEQWESAVRWDDRTDADAQAWRDLLQHRRTDVAVEVARGALSIDLLAENALLTLGSGYARTLGAGQNITLTADDIDLISGRNHLVGSGELRLQAQ